MSHRQTKGGRQEAATSEPRRSESVPHCSPDFVHLVRQYEEDEKLARQLQAPSPDPVHLVRQYEEDERLARQLQEHETSSPLNLAGQASHRDETAGFPRRLQVEFGDVTLDMLSESCLTDIRGQIGEERSSDEFADEEGFDEDEEIDIEVEDEDDNEYDEEDNDEEDEEDDNDEEDEEGDDDEEDEEDDNDEEDEEGDDDEEDEEDDSEGNNNHMEEESNAAVNLEVRGNRSGLYSYEIERLPTRSYSDRSPRSVPNNHEDFNRACQVCLERYSNGDKLRILPCFHEFHSVCIDKWFKENSTCPICRVEVDVSGR